jgi:hypothetical protein
MAAGERNSTEEVGPVKKPIVKGATEKCQREYLDVRL